MTLEEKPKGLIILYPKNYLDYTFLCINNDGYCSSHKYTTNRVSLETTSFGNIKNTLKLDFFQSVQLLTIGTFTDNNSTSSSHSQRQDEPLLLFSQCQPLEYRHKSTPPFQSHLAHYYLLKAFSRLLVN